MFFLPLGVDCRLRKWAETATSRYAYLSSPGDNDNRASFSCNNLCCSTALWSTDTSQSEKSNLVNSTVTWINMAMFKLIRINWLKSRKVYLFVVQLFHGRLGRTKEYHMRWNSYHVEKTLFQFIPCCLMYDTGVAESALWYEINQAFSTFSALFIKSWFDFVRWDHYFVMWELLPKTLSVLHIHYISTIFDIFYITCFHNS